jgi:hypothetical protein
MIIKPTQTINPIDTKKLKKQGKGQSKEATSDQFQSLLDEIDVIELSSVDGDNRKNNSERKDEPEEKNKKEKKLDKFA